MTVIINQVSTISSRRLFPTFVVESYYLMSYKVYTTLVIEIFIYQSSQFLSEDCFKPCFIERFYLPNLKKKFLNLLPTLINERFHLPTHTIYFKRLFLTLLTLYKRYHL